MCLESFLSNSLMYLIRFKYPVLISIDFDDFTSPFTPKVFVSIEKVYQTLETVFQPSTEPQIGYQVKKF